MKKKTILIIIIIVAIVLIMIGGLFWKYIISSLSLKSSYEIHAADGLNMHELPSGAIVKYYIQPVYQQSEITIKNMYTQKRCILLEPLSPKMKMVFSNLGEQKDFEEIYEADKNGKYRYINK